MTTLAISNDHDPGDELDSVMLESARTSGMAQAEVVASPFVATRGEVRVVDWAATVLAVTATMTPVRVNQRLLSLLRW
jgi:hypothetical protein